MCCFVFVFVCICLVIVVIAIVCLVFVCLVVGKGCGGRSFGLRVICVVLCCVTRLFVVDVYDECVLCLCVFGNLCFVFVVCWSCVCITLVICCCVLNRCVC